MIARDLMKENFVIVDPEDDITNVLSKLREKDACFVYRDGIYYGGLTRWIILKEMAFSQNVKARTLAVRTPKLSGDESIEKISRLMIENDFFYLPVFEEGTIIGEVEFYSVLEAGKERLKQLLAKDVMTEAPIYIFETNTIGKAIAVMRRQRVSHLPVIGEEGKVVGVLTARDIVEKFLAPRTRPQKGEIAGEKIPSFRTPVREIMDRVFPQVSPNDPIPLAIDQMKTLRRSFCLVMKNGFLKGIITRKDLLELLVEIPEEERFGVYISSNFEVERDDVMYFAAKIWQKFKEFLQWAKLFVYLKKEGRATKSRYIVRLKLRSHVATWVSKGESYSYYLALKEAFDALETEIQRDKESFLARPEFYEL